MEKALGPEHPDVTLSLNNLALLHRDQGNYAEAAPLYRRSLAIWEKVLLDAPRTAALGHQPSFSTPLHNVWNAAMNRHSGPEVGNGTVSGP